MSTVLIVDSDPHARLVMSVGLAGVGLRAVEAESLAEARGALDVDMEWALVVSELNLPDGSGLELVRSLKADAESAVVPFVFLARDASVESKIAGLEAGADDFLAKPIYLREFVARAREAVRRRDAEHLAPDGLRARYNGRLSGNLALDILGAAVESKRTGQLALADGDEEGTVFFRDGRIVAARCGRLDPPEAALYLLLWERGSFDIEFQPHEEADVVGEDAAALLSRVRAAKALWGKLAAPHAALAGFSAADVLILGDDLHSLPPSLAPVLLALYDPSRVHSTKPTLSARMARVLAEAVRARRGNAAPEPGGPSTPTPLETMEISPSSSPAILAMPARDENRRRWRTVLAFAIPALLAFAAATVWLSSASREPADEQPVSEASAPPPAPTLEPLPEPGPPAEEAAPPPDLGAPPTPLPPRPTAARVPSPPSLNPAVPAPPSDARLGDPSWGGLYREAYRALMARELGTAETAFSRAVALDPRRPESYIGLGRTRLELGRAEAAVEDFERATTAAPKDPRGWLHLATARHYLGRREGARLAYSTYLTLEPSGPTADEVRRILDTL